MPPGDMADNAADQQFDNTVLGTVATPVVLFIWVFFAYALIYFRRKDAADDEDGPPIKGHVGSRPAGSASPRSSCCRCSSSARTSWSVPRVPVPGPGPARSGRRPGTRARRRTQQDLPGPGHRPAVALDVPLPAVLRGRDHPARDPGGRRGAVQHHLARRHPLVLGVRARRQGRRRPRRQQHRLRHREAHRRHQHPLRRALRPAARRDVSTGKVVSTADFRLVDRRPAEPARRGPARCCRRTPRSTSRRSTAGCTTRARTRCPRTRPCQSVSPTPVS
jgi:hypothetical protein